ncbi:MAG: hypothetical protein R3F60_03230 [bacterium]
MLREGDWEPPEPEVPADSPAAQAALKEWQAIQAEMSADRKARREANNASIDRMLSPLGHLALGLRLTDHGLEGEGGLFLRQSTVAQAFASLAREAVAQDQRQRDAYKKTDDLYRRLGEARQRIQEADGGAKEAAPEAAPEDDGKMGEPPAIREPAPDEKE